MAGERVRLGRLIGVQNAYAARGYLDLPLSVARAWRAPAERTTLRQQWGFIDRPAMGPGAPLVWIDVLSGGEVMQIHSFVRHLTALLPDAGLLVSSNNAYSLRVARGIPGVRAVTYTPFDVRSATRRALRRVRPTALVCVENLPVPVLVREAQMAGVRTVLCSGFMSKNFESHETNVRTTPLGGYRFLDAAGAKTLEDADGLVRMGVDRTRIRVVGNMRFDVEYHGVGDDERRQWRARLRLPEGRRVVVAGGVRSGEEDVLLDGLARVKARRGDVTLVIAPSFASPEVTVEAAAARRGLTAWRRSRMESFAGRAVDVIILDTFGELSRLYSIGDVNFIGGSIHARSRLGYGNNIVEPLIHRRPIFFGPSMNRWTEFTKPLLDVYPGLEIQNGDALAAGVLDLLDHPERTAKIEAQSAVFVAEHAEAPRRNAEFVADAVRRAPRARS